MRVSFHPHQTGPISPDALSDARVRVGSADREHVHHRAVSLDSTGLQGRHLRRRGAVLQDRLGAAWGQAELRTRRWGTWFLVWALPLTSCVVWGQMLGHSGPQWFVKLGCTGT